MKGELSDIEWYQRDPDSYTVLVLGEVFFGKKPLLRNVFFGKKAYEAYALYEYIQEVLEIRNSSRPSFSFDWAGRYFYLYIALNLLSNEPCEFAEIGSTLYSSIDKLGIIREALVQEGGSLSKISFIGVEKSGVLANVAEILHQETNIKHFSDWTKVPVPIGNRVGTSYQAASYAFESTDDLVKWFTQMRFSIDCVFFSTDDNTKHVSSLGKQLTLFNLNEFLEKMKSKGFMVSFITGQQIRHPFFSYNSIWFVVHNLNSKEVSLIEKNYTHTHVDSAFNINLNGGFDLFVSDNLPQVVHSSVAQNSNTFSSKSESILQKSIETVKNWLSTRILHNNTNNSNPMFDFEYPEAYRLLSEHIFKLGQKDKALSLVSKIRKTLKSNVFMSGDRENSILLKPPFFHEEGYCWVAKVESSQVGSGDMETNLNNSTIILFENEIPLGPPHSLHDNIRNVGLGAYSHWKDRLYFSTSDGSDPNENGKIYRIMIIV